MTNHYQDSHFTGRAKEAQGGQVIRQRSWRSLYFYPSVSTAPRFAGTRMRSHGAGGAKGRGVASDTEKPPGRPGQACLKETMELTGNQLPTFTRRKGITKIFIQLMNRFLPRSCCVNGIVPGILWKSKRNIKLVS